MLNLIKLINYKLAGWPGVAMVIALEILIIYIFSNIPFIISALETPTTEEGSFYSSFLGVLQNEIYNGQLLAFVCALIAPIVFWSFIEERKLYMGKIISLLSFSVLIAAAYLHKTNDDFSYFSSFDLYKAAVILWILSIVARMLPPERPDYHDIVDDDVEKFVSATSNLKGAK